MTVLLATDLGLYHHHLFRLFSSFIERCYLINFSVLLSLFTLVNSYFFASPQAAVILIIMSLLCKILSIKSNRRCHVSNYSSIVVTGGVDTAPVDSDRGFGVTPVPYVHTHTYPSWTWPICLFGSSDIRARVMDSVVLAPPSCYRQT